MANVHLALKQGLTIIPVINKIDLPNADIPTVKKQLEDILAIPSDEAIEASAKAGLGITEILEAIVHRIPPPRRAADEILRGLVFDSIFDGYRGVVAYIRVATGSVSPGMGVKLDVHQPELRDQGGRGVYAENVSTAAPQCRGCRIFHRQH